MSDPASAVCPVAPRLKAARAVMISLLYFGLQLATGLLAGVWVGIYIAATQNTADEGVLNAAIQQITMPASLVGMLVAGFVAFLLTRKALPGPIRDGALATIGWRAVGSISVARNVLLGVLAASVYLFIAIQFPPDQDGQAWGPMTTAILGGGWSLHVWAVLAIVAAPPIEEFIFRGVLLEGLTNRLGGRLAAVLVTALFVMAHGNEAVHYPPAWVGLALLGIATVWTRLSSGSLVPAMAVHLGYNLCIVLATYADLA